jgi:riboflavin-specific deaminase-like protein
MERFNQRLALAKEHRQRTGRPLVSLCYAQSLDGSLTIRRGQPLELSGPGSMKLTHHLRASHDAILVGAGTVLADNPRLDVRFVEGHQPQPVILDSRLRIPCDSYLVQNRRPWLASLEARFKEPGMEVAGALLVTLPQDEHGRVSLPPLLDRLAEMGINSLMVEGGAQVITSFLTQRMVDQVALTIAPLFVGGLNLLENLLAEPDGSGVFPRLDEVEFERLDSDLIVFGRIA